MNKINNEVVEISDDLNTRLEQYFGFKEFLKG